MKLSYAKMFDAVVELLTRSGVSDDDARTVAESLVRANARGIHSHTGWPIADIVIGYRISIVVVTVNPVARSAGNPDIVVARAHNPPSLVRTAFCPVFHPGQNIHPGKPVVRPP